MPKLQIPIANGFYESESLPISAQRCINWYPNIVQTQGLSQETLFGVPGINQLTTTGVLNQENRGMLVKEDILYFVNGTNLYSLDRTVGTPDTFSFTSLGTVTGTGPVSMAENGTQLMIVVPGTTSTGYIYDEDAAGFSTIGSGFKSNGEPQGVVFVDGFFVCNTSTKKIIQSNSNDGLTWTATDFGTAEADPDPIKALFVFGNKLFALGSQTIEKYRNIGGSGYVFQREEGVIPKGIFADFSVVSTTNSFMFIGGGENESPAAWIYTGNGVDKVSTTAIDNLLNNLTDAELEDVIGVSYAEKGAYFTGFSLSDTDIYYDSITNRWHERSTIIDGQLSGWRVGFMATAYGRVIVGDSIDGRIGELDSGLYTEYGDTIFRRFRVQPFSNQGDTIFVPEIELRVESGVGDLTTEEPLMRMRFSDDAKTYSSETTRKMGKIGEYFKRCIWRRQGRIPWFRVYEFTMTDPVKPDVIGLYLRPKGSSNA